MHLHVVLSQGDKDGFHLVASVTTIYPDAGYDNTCTFQAGEHPFIQHPSYILYRQMCPVRGSHILAMLEKGVYSVKEECTDKVLKKICDGIEVSDFTRQHAVNYYLSTK
jgi:hypothetical protein